MAYTALQYGSKGEDVKRLQTALNGAGYNSGAVGGIYGEKTEAALKSYQQANGLSVSGALDEATYNSLYGQATQQPAQAEQAAGNAAQQTEGLKQIAHHFCEELYPYARSKLHEAVQPRQIAGRCPEKAEKNEQKAARFLGQRDTLHGFTTSKCWYQL